MSRRRTSKEPSFGSDSFLDVIANLVGIVIILIVMIGARVRELPTLVPPSLPPLPQDDQAAAISGEKEAYQIQIADLQRRLLEQLRKRDQLATSRQSLQQARARLTEREAKATVTASAADAALAHHAADTDRAAAEARALDERLADLQRAVTEIEARPPDKKLLRFHLPVSRPVAAEERLFECRHGRVTHIDLESLLGQVKRSLPSKVDDLRNRWSVTATTEPVGAFRLKYEVERERGSALDGAFADLPPADGTRFGYGVNRWEVVPVWPTRGETLTEALTADSRFLRLVGGYDPEEIVITLVVYPDSFELFRHLRDHLYERGFVVAGRPLPPDAVIAGSRDGFRSRGQ